MTQVYVAVGSNVDPEKNIAQACREMLRAFPGTRFSRWYRNQAVGFDGADFINGVAAFGTELPVRELVNRLHRIEAACGRPRDAPRWAPRSMDLDVLLFGTLVCQEPGLAVPRPDLLRRAYMLGPLAELAPQALHPTLGVTIGELWEQFDQQGHPMQLVNLSDACA